MFDVLKRTKFYKYVGTPTDLGLGLLDLLTVHCHEELPIVTHHSSLLTSADIDVHVCRSIELSGGRTDLDVQSHPFL